VKPEQDSTPTPVARQEADPHASLDDPEALIERVLTEGETLGLVPTCVVCGRTLYRRADALYCGPTCKQRAKRARRQRE
jgi:uncharacterized Zn finger protein (UPF0148 family)